VFRDFYFLKNT